MNGVVNAGNTAGLSWASTAETLDEAQTAIEEIEQELPGGLDYWITLENAYTPAQNLYFLLHGVEWHDRDRSEAAEFWEWAVRCDDAEPEIDFLLGFALGVLDFGAMT